MLLPRFASATIVALLFTLVFIFAFRTEKIRGKTVHVALIAVPIFIQIYANVSLAMDSCIGFVCPMRSRRRAR